MHQVGNIDEVDMDWEVAFAALFFQVVAMCLLVLFLCISLPA
jgi:hypothetical protein